MPSPTKPTTLDGFLSKNIRRFFSMAFNYILVVKLWAFHFNCIKVIYFQKEQQIPNKYSFDENYGTVIQVAQLKMSLTSYLALLTHSTTLTQRRFQWARKRK